MKTKPNFGLALAYVKDIEAAKRFYVDILGLEVQRDSPVFVQFQNFAIATDESMGGSRDLELYWLIDDAEASFRDLSAKAEICLPLKQMPFGKVFGIKDPDGQPRYLLEFAATRPSQPVG
jgi:catechol 2,3-dioxygenase-like lactoylglutathione lyase family enzyme